MNEKLKPCPFCGNNDQSRYRWAFSKDERKVNGIYYELCRITCELCCGSIRQAGVTREKAEENAIKAWNRRQNDD